jgi:hypothetical protein
MTTTTDHTLTTFDRPAHTASTVLAQLPAQLLHIAAQFASDDIYRGSLHCVHVACVDETEQLPAHIRVASTNGHYAFRCRLPIGEGRTFDDPGAAYWCALPELLLTAAPLRKRSPYATQALVRDDGEVRLFGARRGEALGLLEARPIGEATTGSKTAFPPTFDSLWPDPATMGNAPQAPIAWNASYMIDICAIAKRFSPNGVISFRSGALPTTPLYLSCDGEELPTLEFLLMPVQVRA